MLIIWLGLRSVAVSVRTAGSPERIGITWFRGWVMVLVPTCMAAVRAKVGGKLVPQSYTVRNKSRRAVPTTTIWPFTRRYSVILTTTTYLLRPAEEAETES